VNHSSPEFVKPWNRPGRRTERNCPRGTKCDENCLRPSPSQAHCGVCGETFSRVSNFDRHRRDGWCLDPVTLSMTADDRGVWRSPKSERMDSFLDQVTGALPLPGL
jgi:hypothetical protein